jgi:hypothetical protein
MAADPCLIEDGIPNASLRGRNIAELKIDELKLWLKCRDDWSEGIKTKAELGNSFVNNMSFESSSVLEDDQYLMFCPFILLNKKQHVSKDLWKIVNVGGE